jgi:hypothetical protein
MDYDSFSQEKKCQIKELFNSGRIIDTDCSLDINDINEHNRHTVFYVITSTKYTQCVTYKKTSQHHASVEHNVASVTMIPFLQYDPNTNEHKFYQSDPQLFHTSDFDDNTIISVIKKTIPRAVLERGGASGFSSSIATAPIMMEAIDSLSSTVPAVPRPTLPSNTYVMEFISGNTGFNSDGTNYPTIIP